MKRGCSRRGCYKHPQYNTLAWLLRALRCPEWPFSLSGASGRHHNASWCTRRSANYQRHESTHSSRLAIRSYVFYLEIDNAAFNVDRNLYNCLFMYFKALWKKKIMKIDREISTMLKTTEQRWCHAVFQWPDVTRHSWRLFDWYPGKYSALIFCYTSESFARSL